MFRHALAFALAVIAGPALSQALDLHGGQLSMLDTNSDGSVTRDEFQAFVTSAFQQLDADGNGSLSTAELGPHVPADAFDELDANGDGAISPEEFATRMDVDFDTADTDGDGVLN